MEIGDQDSVRQKLYRHREELDLLTDFIRKQEIKNEKGIIFFRIAILVHCQNYLKILSVVIETDRLESYFGVHVLLNELDYLFNNTISKFKIEFNNYTIDMNYHNSNNLLESLKHDLSTISFMKFDANSRVFSYNIEYLHRKYKQVVCFDELVNYYAVGTVLKDDPVSMIFLEELKKLHSESKSKSKSRFSALICPSYMGKTQMAFTIANVVNMIYLNFVTIHYFNPQPICATFFNLAGCFMSTIEYDTTQPLYENSLKRSHDIILFGIGFKTLGLIYILIRMREIRTDLDGLEWLKELASIDQVMIPSMTCREFNSKTSDINLENHLIFIDELPKHEKKVCSFIKFLRNLCCAMKLPINISSSNSEIRSMLDDEKESSARCGQLNSYPWVQVTVKTPKCSLKALAHLIKFRPHNSKISSSCLKDFINPNSENILYTELFNNIYGSENQERLNQVDPVKKLIEFILNQSKTCLSGIIVLILIELFNILPNFHYPKTLWDSLLSAIINVIAKKKLCLNIRDCLIYSAHLLTFPSCQKESLEKGPFTSNSVSEHFYHYSEKDDDTFRLDLSINRQENEKERSLLRNGTKIKENCFFPEINKDFFTSFISLGVWNIIVVQFEKEYGRRCHILANLYTNYLENIFVHDTALHASITDSFTFKLFGHWSICHASYLNFNGETNGIDLFTEFVKNIQIMDKNIELICFEGLDFLPDDLISILSRIQVPYLVRFPTDEIEKSNFIKMLADNIGEFVQLGHSFLSDSKIGWEVKFDMKFDHVPCFGVIECKLWAQVIGYASIFKYYKKACDSSVPLSFLVCRKLQKSISSNRAASNLTTNLSKSANKDTEYLAEIEEEEFYDSDLDGDTKETVTRNSTKKDYYSLLNDLWIDPKNHIDIYAVKYKNNHLYGEFTVSSLKTFSNPKGAFILVESTFTLPTLSSYHQNQSTA